MLSSYLLALILTPSLVLAGLFPRDSLVKMLDPPGFRKALKANETSMIAFVAPWCGHCQRLVPEYSRAALGLYPLIPVYAVDCDNEQNKRLCAQQDVKGFPTVKLFPRGKTLPPMVYDGAERTASALFYWAERRVPNTVTKLYKLEDVSPWIEKTVDSGIPRALLLTKDKKVPLLWKVLGNKYKDQIQFATHKDKKGLTSVALGFEAGGKKESKVLIYPAGSKHPVRYEGLHKHDSLSKFFDSVLDGTADLKVANEEAAKEEFVPDEKELEIERKQEADRIALAHGGYADLIDFEKAIKAGAGADYHDTHGYPGMMGAPPAKKKTVDASGKTGYSTSTTTTAFEAVVTSVPSEQVVFNADATSSVSDSPTPAGSSSPSSTTVVEDSEKTKSTETEHPKDEL